MNDQGPVAGKRDIELIDYLRIVLRRKWLIGVGTVAVALLVFVATLMRPRTYEASVTLLVTESKIPRPEGVDGARVVPPETFEAVLKSQSLASETIRRFNLNNAPFNLSPTRLLTDHIAIRMLRGTNLITLTVSFPDPKLAADVANFMAQQGLELNARLNQTDTVATKEYIQRQRDEAGTVMGNRQAALVDFKRTVGLESLRAEQRILLDAKGRLADAYSDYTTRIPGLRSDVSELTQALARQEQLLALTKSVFQDPALLAAAQDKVPVDLKSLSSLQLKSQEINTVYQAVQSELIGKTTALASAQSQQQSIERAIKENKTRLTSVERQIADAEARLEELTRNYTLSLSGYELFARKFDEASLSVASRITELKIVDPALVPQTPLSRNVVRSTVVAAAVTLTLLLLLTFFLEYLKTVRETEARA
jgi:uncharacterized protein involved in exopolysaccharide biosynthesis